MTSTSPDDTLVPPPAAAGTGDRCSTCGAHLAADQRYCVECGTRRAAPRLALMEGPTPAIAAADAVAAPRRPRASAGLTLLAGIATLLVAMGVGILIGRSGNQDPAPRAAAVPVQVVTVGGGAPAAAAPDAGAGSTTAAPTSTTSSGGGTGTTSSSSGAKTTPTTATKRTSSTAAPPPAVKVGSKGTGKGYKDGTFTGDFFGG